MFAQIYYFSEWKSWGVTTYDVLGNQRNVESVWCALKPDAIAEAERAYDAGTIDRYEVFTRDGRLQLTVCKVKNERRLTRHV